MPVFIDSAFDEGADVAKRETRVIFNFRGESQLPQWDHLDIGADGTFDDDGIEIGSRGVNCG